VIAPAGPVPPDTFEAGVARLGQRYRVSYDGGVLARDGFLAGDDERRLHELERALGDPGVRAIFCARGGYGITRLLARLDTLAPALVKNPKILVGFSDVTVLLSWVAQRAGLRSVHGPVVSQLGRLPDADLQALWDLIEQPAPPPPIAGLSQLAGNAPVASGGLIGGNLEVLTRLCGTPWQPDLRGAILLVEEVGERPYRIDRELTHLDAAGVLRGLAGAVIGDLIRCEEPATAWPGQSSPDARAVVAERLAHAGVPLAMAGLPVGHGDRNRALPHGARVTLDAARGELVFLEGAVA
jgi:muramoyltetrapeptide carboxypeptidase